MKALSVLIMTLIAFFGSNAVFYCFNLTSYLIGKEIVVFPSMLWNYVFLIAYCAAVLLFLMILYAPFAHRLYDRRVLFLNNAVHVIIVLFAMKVLLENEKLALAENASGLILSLFLATYVFYYSICFFGLLKYKGNR